MGGGEDISDVLVSEREDEHFVNSREKKLAESLVSAIILVEECRGGVKSIAKFRDLGASGVGCNEGYRARVYGHDEGGVRQGVVDSGLQSQLEKAEGDATKVGWDRGGD